MYSIVVRSLGKLGRYPTPELRHQFGLRTAAFFGLIFVCILIAPTKGSSDGSARLRRLQVAVAVAVALIQTFFTVRFLHEVWSAASIDQVHASMRFLIWAGLALYLLDVAKMLLPRTVSAIDALFAKQQSNSSSFGN
jgi:hypothetical protein